ncbi:DUF2752 domain-containing protein [soil metagenome]
MTPAEPRPVARRVRIAQWTRIALVLMALGLIAVFTIAAWIHPYDAAGNARTMATHMQLGMPPCSMIALIGKPCPSCGMTTSFALLMHGDVMNSLRANWVGTLLALAWLALIPWGIVSAVRSRFVGVRNLELAFGVAVGVLLTLMLIRWAFVLLL